MLDSFYRLLASKLCSDKPVALVYHSICTPGKKPDSRWSLPYNQFIAQLDTIQNLSWKTGRISDLATTKLTSPKTIYITFDDGFSDNLPAFTALAERNMQATLYPVSRALGGKSTWTDSDTPQRSMLSHNDLRELHVNGFEIGSHGTTHTDLTQLDHQQLGNELEGAKTQLEDTLGETVTSLAYPYGRFNDEVLTATQNAGYQTACSTRSGWALASDDPYKIHRITIFAEDNLQTWLKKIITCANQPTNTMILKQLKSGITQKFG